MPADVRAAFLQHCTESMTSHGMSRDEARAVLDRHFGPSQYHSIHLQTLFDAYVQAGPLQVQPGTSAP